MPHGGLEFLQFATQTHIEPGSSPINVESHSKASKIAEEVAPLVEQTILDLAQHTQYGFDVENDKLAYRCQPEHALVFQKYPCTYVNLQGKGRCPLGGRVSSCEGKVKTRGDDQGSAPGSTRLHPLFPPLSEPGAEQPPGSQNPTSDGFFGGFQCEK